MKTSYSALWHRLSCQQPSVIQIYHAWDELGDCRYYFKPRELKELKKMCNNQNICYYKKNRKWKKCHRWFPAWTKSVILYDCVYHRGTVETTTRKKMSSIKARTFTISSASSTKFKSFASYPVSSKSDGIMSTTTLVTNTRPPLKEYSSQSNDAAIAGSVIGVLGLIALLLLSIYCILKRRKTGKQKATSSDSATNAVGQNGNVLYVVPENISTSLEHTDDDQPPAYHTLNYIPDENHIYLKSESRHQETNYYNLIPGTGIIKSIQNGDYNHTDAEDLKVSGRESEDYNHISISGRDSDVPIENQMKDDYNHIRCTGSVISHDVTEYNHIN